MKIEIVNPTGIRVTISATKSVAEWKQIVSSIKQAPFHGYSHGFADKIKAVIDRLEDHLEIRDDTE